MPGPAFPRSALFHRPGPALALAAVLGLALPALVPATAMAQQITTSPLDTSPAQEPAALLADRIELTGSDQLIAEGAVEVIWQGNHLTAPRLVYDSTRDLLTIDGPMRLTEPGTDGAILIADQAELSRDLQNGVLTGARMVMARELQLAAAKIEREGGKITTFSQVVASSCTICEGDPRPLWEIRARKITHDAAKRKLTYEGAQLRAMGVPVLFLPRLSTPDPSVDRMTGFLRPGFRTTSLLGSGVKLPYFITLGDSADLTVTPYISSSRTATLGARYRQAFRTGAITVEGALSRDDILPDELRGYLFAFGQFALPRDFSLGLELRLVSDTSYLDNYDITDEDRLWSGVTLERVRPDEWISAKLGNTHTIRSGESNLTQPMLAGNLRWVQIFHPNTVGGELSFDWQLDALRRASDDPFDGSDADTVADGRDRLRASLVADWRRNWVLPAGVMAQTQTELAFDAVRVAQDASFDPSTFRALPSVGVALRWPWVKAGVKTTQVIEPVAQVVWSRDTLSEVPNEDSLLVEFDEGNLFSFSRLPGGDARERGLRANLGLGWTLDAASGWSLGMVAGRVLRADDLDQFSTGSGLSGLRSDWLVTTHLNLTNGLLLSNRALFDDDFDLTREELRFGYGNARYSLALGYAWLRADTDEGRTEDTSEIRLTTSWKIAEGWTGRAQTYYDFTAARADKAAVGLQYANECVNVDVSLSRKYSSSTSVDADTTFGLTVELAGFGGSTAKNAARRVCRR